MANRRGFVQTNILPNANPFFPQNLLDQESHIKPRTDSEHKLTKAKEILDKISPSTFDEHTMEFLELRLCAKEEGLKVVDHIFDQVLKNPDLCTTYANLCKWQVNEEYAFRHILNSKCQSIFQQVKNITDESIVHLETEISRHYEGKTKDLLEEALLALKEKVKRNMLCYIKFIDELYHHSIIDGSILQWCFDRIEELNELEKNSWKTSEKVNYSTEAQQDENTLQERSQEKSKQLTLNLKQENEYLKEMVDVLQTTILDGGGIKDKRVEELEKVNQELQKQNHDLDQKIESIITEYRTNLDDKELRIQNLEAKLALSEQNNLELIESTKMKELQAQNLQATLETTVNELDELNRKLTSEHSAKEAEVQNLSSKLSSAEQNISSLKKTLKEQKTIAEKFKHDLQKAVMECDGMAQQLFIEQAEKKQKLESLKNEWDNVTRKNYRYLFSCVAKCFQESLAARDLGFLERETNNDAPAFNNYHELFAVPESVASSLTSFDVLSDLEGSQGMEENVQDDQDDHL